MSRDYVSHLQDNGGPSTICGEPWQGWQVPGSAALEPHEPPRTGGRLDRIRCCPACLNQASQRNYFPYEHPHTFR